MFVSLHRYLVVDTLMAAAVVVILDVVPDALPQVRYVVLWVDVDSHGGAVLVCVSKFTKNLDSEAYLIKKLHYLLRKIANTVGNAKQNLQSAYIWSYSLFSHSKRSLSHCFRFWTSF